MPRLRAFPVFVGRWAEGLKIAVQKASKRRVDRSLVVAFILLLTFFALAIRHASKPLQTDEAVVLDLASHLTDYRPNIENLPPNPYKETLYDVPFWFHPPLLPILMMPFSSPLVSKVITLMVMESTFLLVFLLTRKRFGEKAAVYALGLLVLNPDLIRVASFVWCDQYMFFFLFLGLCLYEYDHTSLGLLTNVFSTNAKIVYPLFSLTFLGRGWREGVKAFTVAALSLIPFWLWSWISTANPLYLVQTWLDVGSQFEGTYAAKYFPYFKKWFYLLLVLLVLGLFLKKIDYRKCKDLLPIVIVSFLVYNHASWTLLGAIVVLSILFAVLLDRLRMGWKLLLVSVYGVTIIPQLFNALLL